MRWSGAGLVLLVACGSPPLDLVVTAIEPDAIVAGVESQVLIRGEFWPKVTVSFDSGHSSLDAEFRATLGSTALTRVTWINGEILTATVPAELPEGTHDLLVIDPNGNRETLSTAFRSVSDACPSLRVLLVVRDQNPGDGDLDLSADDAAVVDLLENTGHTVELFEPTTGGCGSDNDDPQSFENAVAAASWDAIYVADSCETETLVLGSTDDPTAPFHLNDAAVGVLFNDDALLDNAFFGDTHGSDQADRFVLNDDSTFVTSFLSTGSVTLLDGADAPIGWLDRTGTVAPGVVALGEAPSSSDHLSLLLVDAGAELLYGVTAPARRASIPAFAASRWTRSARRLALRALLWVAGEDSSCVP